MQFSVQSARWWDGGWKQGFKAVGYSGPGVNFPTESKVTEDKAEAEDWAARKTAGEAVPEAKWGMFADD